MEYESLRQIASSLAVFAVAVGVALLARRLLLSVLHRWAAKTDTTIDDILLSVVRAEAADGEIGAGFQRRQVEQIGGDRQSGLFGAARQSERLDTDIAPLGLALRPDRRQIGHDGLVPGHGATLAHPLRSAGAM